MTDQEKKIKKEEEYLAYIKEHIDNVKIAFRRFIEEKLINYSTNREVQEAVQILKETIQKHDESKYSDEEFDEYRKMFFPTDYEEKPSKDDFDNNPAWIHHYKSNPHHPEYWMNEDGTYNEMTMTAIIEMCCDWEAMAYKFGGSAYEYYTKNKESKNANMHPNSVKNLELIIVSFM